MELIFTLEQIEKAARQVLDHTGRHGVVAFYGQMGAGKTTFIKKLCAVLGAEDMVNSPTFTLVNEYLSTDKTPIYHFDFYRINKLEEAADMGCEEYFYAPGALCLIEWPELVEPLLPEDTVRLQLDVLPTGERRIILKSEV
ncbi:MAG TPA: tRNA (adenosine(37)-N6)-threonylcarbamoyltransferase complex ATPase subunit type 1 TsaE [Bacteroidales bacterium]|nr:tRNA (adenosine(37)-N6)-threonylcarbamoyltransferase complex ATPase subunit type 1 TsaE [Bacteroidales bacterium]